MGGACRETGSVCAVIPPRPPSQGPQRPPVLPLAPGLRGAPPTYTGGQAFPGKPPMARSRTAPELPFNECGANCGRTHPSDAPLVSEQFLQCVEEEVRLVAHQLYRSKTGNPDDKLNWHEAERKLVHWLFMHAGPFQWLRQHLESRLSGQGLGLEDALEQQRTEMAMLSAQLEERDQRIGRLLDALEAKSEPKPQHPNAQRSRKDHLEAQVADLNATVTSLRQELATAHAGLAAKANELVAMAKKCEEAQASAQQATAAATAAAAAAANAQAQAQAQVQQALQAQQRAAPQLHPAQGQLAQPQQAQQGQPGQAALNSRATAALAAMKAHGADFHKAFAGKAHSVELHKAFAGSAAGPPDYKAGMAAQGRQVAVAEARARELEKALGEKESKLAEKEARVKDLERELAAAAAAAAAQTQHPPPHHRQPQLPLPGPGSGPAPALPDGLPEDVDALCSRVRALEAAVLDRDKKLGEARARAQNFEAAATEAKARLSAQARRIAEEVRDTIVDKENRLGQTQARVEALETSNAELRNRLEDRERRLAQAEGGLRQVQDADRRLSDALLRVQELEGQNAALADHAGRKDDQERWLQSRVRDLEAAVRDLRTNTEERERRLANAESQSRELEALRSTLSEQTSRFEERERLLQGRSRDLETALAEQRAENEERGRQMARVEARLRELEATEAALAAERAAAAEREEHLLEVEQRILELEELHAEACAQRAAAEAQGTRLEVDLGAQRASIEEQSKRLSEAATRARELEAVLELQDRRLTEGRTKVAELEAELRTEQARASTLEEQLRLQQAQLQQQLQRQREMQAELEGAQPGAPGGAAAPPRRERREVAMVDASVQVIKTMFYQAVTTEDEVHKARIRELEDEVASQRAQLVRIGRQLAELREKGIVLTPARTPEGGSGASTPVDGRGQPPVGSVAAAAAAALTAGMAARAGEGGLPGREPQPYASGPQPAARIWPGRPTTNASTGGAVGAPAPAAAPASTVAAGPPNHASPRGGGPGAAMVSVVMSPRGLPGSPVPAPVPAPAAAGGEEKEDAGSGSGSASTAPPSPREEGDAPMLLDHLYKKGTREHQLLARIRHTRMQRYMVRRGSRALPPVYEGENGGDAVELHNEGLGEAEGSGGSSEAGTETPPDPTGALVAEGDPGPVVTVPAHE